MNRWSARVPVELSNRALHRARAPDPSAPASRSATRSRRRRRPAQLRRLLENHLTRPGQDLTFARQPPGSYPGPRRSLEMHQMSGSVDSTLRLLDLADEGRFPLMSPVWRLDKRDESRERRGPGLPADAGSPWSPEAVDKPGAGSRAWALHCRLEHADHIRLSPCGSCGQPPVGSSERREAGVLEETHDSDQIIQRVAALDVGKAELTCCVRVPGQGRSGRLQEV